MRKSKDKIVRAPFVEMEYYSDIKSTSGRELIYFFSGDFKKYQTWNSLFLSEITKSTYVNFYINYEISGIILVRQLPHNKSKFYFVPQKLIDEIKILIKMRAGI